jgi:hypothetical protein
MNACIVQEAADRTGRFRLCNRVEGHWRGIKLPGALIHVGRKDCYDHRVDDVFDFQCPAKGKALISRILKMNRFGHQDY